MSTDALQVEAGGVVVDFWVVSPDQCSVKEVFRFQVE